MCRSKQMFRAFGYFLAVFIYCHGVPTMPKGKKEKDSQMEYRKSDMRKWVVAWSLTSGIVDR
jgi:hypothetical protein